ncbi:MAG: hypothetical protein LJF04_02345 [Gemmatimonadetes bacterium]|nr:hypothetical protein [Gemmatimonadota bacterium]
MSDQGRIGGALVLCVLLVLALGLLAHGALLMSREELAVSRAGLHVLQARAAADAGISAAVTGEGPGLPDSLPQAWRVPLLEGTVGGARYRVTASRLSREVWLAEADGAQGQGPWLAKEATALWSLDPVARVGAFRAVVEVGAEAATAGVTRVATADVFHSHPELDITECLPWGRALDSLASVSGGTLQPVASVAAAGGTTSQPTLGLLDGDDLKSLASNTVAGRGTPTPSTGSGGCLTADPWNWGDPEDDLSPCRDRMPLVAAEGDLMVEGGAGQGVLVVLGDLVVTGGGRFYGVVLVRGGLVVEQGAAVVGLVRAVGGITVGSDAEISGSACWALRSLTAARPVLARPRPLRGTGRLGPLRPSPLDKP